MVNGNRKGKVGERELSAKLRELGFPDSRRGQQFCGRNGDADIVGIPGVHIECKRTQSLNLDRAMEQAIMDSPLTNGNKPAVFHRKNGKSWLVTMRLEDWAKIYQDSVRKKDDSNL